MAGRPVTIGRERGADITENGRISFAAIKGQCGEVGTGRGHIRLRLGSAGATAWRSGRENRILPSHLQRVVGSN